VDNLIHHKKIPPIVIIRIANPSQAVRQRKLSCQTEFANFLARELPPFVRRNYNVSSEATKTAVGGYSLGGLAAASASLKHQETFGLTLAQSGSFWFEPTRNRHCRTELARARIRSLAETAFAILY